MKIDYGRNLRKECENLQILRKFLPVKVYPLKICSIGFSSSRIGEGT